MTETGKHKPLVKPTHDVLFRAIIDDKGPRGRLQQVAGRRRNGWPDTLEYANNDGFWGEGSIMVIFGK